MNRICLIIYFVLLLPVLASAQSIKFSEIDRADGRDMEFEIIGKMNDRVLIYKNVRSNHRINIYDSDMQIISG
jgi:hypothetical protein